MSKQPVKAVHADSIHCDADGCSAVVQTELDLTEAASVQVATEHGWQAWLGTMRSYHRCPLHAVDVTVSVAAGVAHDEVAK